MLATDFRRILAGVMREQSLTTPDAARICGVPLPVFVQLLQGPTTTDLLGAEAMLNRLGVGLQLTRCPLADLPRITPVEERSDEDV